MDNPEALFGLKSVELLIPIVSEWNRSHCPGDSY
jgi:hypothetical protein